MVVVVAVVTATRGIDVQVIVIVAPDTGRVTDTIRIGTVDEQVSIVIDSIGAIFATRNR